MDITPLKSGSDSSDLCAIGCWTDISIRILTIPGLEPVQIDYLGEGGLEVKMLVSYILASFSISTIAYSVSSRW